MGRRKTKKPKSHGGGSGKHSAHGARAAEAPPPGPAPDAGVTEVGGACAAQATPRPQPVPQATPPGAESKGRASPKPAPSAGKAAVTGTKALQRAQIQGELNSLEAQLAAVEDLQARMAAKLSSVDSNIIMPDAQPDANLAAAAHQPAATSQPEKEVAPKPKKNKKSKQDKAIKQEENLKEAQQMKAASAKKLEQATGGKGECGKSECGKGECQVENWEIIGQVELVPEGNLGQKETSMIGQTSVNTDIEQVEIVLEEKVGNTEPELPGQTSAKDLTPTTIKVSPTCEKTMEELKKDINSKKVEEEAAEKKIIADYNAEKDSGQDLNKALASEIAGYLMADYNRMLNLRLALDAECHSALMNTPDLPPTDLSSCDELTPKKVGHYFSYADAVKSSLQKECEDQQQRMNLEDAEEFHQEELARDETSGKLSDLTSEEQTHVYQYMKMEYEPFMRRLEAEDAEVVYREAAADGSKSPSLPRIEVSLAGTPEGSDDDVKMEAKPCCEINVDLAVMEDLAKDYNSMKMMSSCIDAEIKYYEMITNESCITAPKACCNTTTKQEENIPDAPTVNTEKEVAKYLKDEYEKMHALKAAVDSVDTCLTTTQSDEDRHAEAMRRAVMVEAATMEVEYEGAEQQFLLQQEQRRARPWRWVRADTAPAHIDVPETVHEPISDTETELDSRSMGVVTDMHGLVFQCRDVSTQANNELDLQQQLQEEVKQRVALQKHVRVLEQQVKDQRQTLADHRKMTNQLETSICDKKAEASEAKMMAAEYKSRCTDLEQSLDTARSVVNTLEDQVNTSHRMSSGVDFVLEANMENIRASQAQAKIDDLETKLLLSKAEVQKLLDKLSDRNKQLDLMPVVVHQQHMQKAEGVRQELQLKVAQLESELAQLRNVRDVWGSCQQPAALQQGGGLAMGFPVTGVDLPPVHAVNPTCLSALGLGTSPPDGSTSLTSGLLSGLSDLQAKATPVVAPLAMQEDMDSDDDVSWSSASEQLRDSRADPAPGAPLSSSALRSSANKSCLPPNSLLGKLDCRGVGATRAGLPPCAATSAAASLPLQPTQLQQQQVNQTSTSPKPKGNKRRHRQKKTPK